MEVSLFGNTTMIYGMKGVGKSNLTAHLLNQPIYENSIVYDLTREHKAAGVDRIIPDYRSGEKAKQEFDTALRAIVTENDRDRRPDLFVGEEVSRYAPNSGKTPDSLLDLVDLSRHYATGFVGISRRPAQVDTNLTELADNLIIFMVQGKNDKQRLNREADGLGDAASDLDPYEFIVANKWRDWSVHAPVPEYDTTGKL